VGARLKAGGDGDLVPLVFGALFGAFGFFVLLCVFTLFARHLRDVLRDRAAARRAHREASLLTIQMRQPGLKGTRAKRAAVRKLAKLKARAAAKAARDEAEIGRRKAAREVEAKHLPSEELSGAEVGLGVLQALFTQRK